VNQSRRRFLSLLRSAATASPLLATECSRAAGGVDAALGLRVFAMPQAAAEISDLQVRSNSTLWDQERWGPRLISIKRADVTHLIGYNGHLQGGVRLAEGDIEPRKVPYGFTSSSATLNWEVQVPDDSEYQVAILYHAGQEDNLGYRVELQCGNTSLATLVRSPTDVPWKGGTPALPAFRRDWFNRSILLKRGVNKIALRLPDPPQKQVQLALKDLADPPNGWPKRSFHVLSAELVQPEVLPQMKVGGKRLRSNTDWMVKGKYGVFVSWVPEGYPLYGTKQTYHHYEQVVNAFDVEAFTQTVEETGASWVIFTTTHGKYYYPGPLKAMDRVLTGRTCRRDLVGELADRLGEINVRLMLYFHPGPSASEDREWANAGGISPVDDNRYNQIMLDIFSEIGHRYGQRLSGWYVDGAYGYYVRNTSFGHLTRALKAGNPQRAVGYFGWIFPKWSVFGGDFTAYVTYPFGPLPPPMPREWFIEGGPYEDLQPNFDLTMEQVWTPTGPLNGKWPPPMYRLDTLVHYFKRLADGECPVAINLVTAEDVTSEHAFVNPESLKILKRIRKAVKGR
jgi:Alpha-L-fucosidase